MKQTTDILDLPTKSERIELLLKQPLEARREINNRSLYSFLQYFWPEVSNHAFTPNWHIEFLCKELELVARRVAAWQ